MYILQLIKNKKADNRLSYGKRNSILKIEAE